MFEKIYTRLFHLYPSRFRKEYEGEALQLIRDRLRDETGFLKRARLWWDVLTDVCSGLPQTCRSSHAVTEAALLSPNAEGIPTFSVLEKEPLGRGPILLGGTLSVSAMVFFGFLLSLSVDHRPVPGSRERMSPIEAVVDRLNRATMPDTLAIVSEEPSGSKSVRPNEQKLQPWLASASTSDGPVSLAGGRGDVDKQKLIVSTVTGNAMERPLYPARASIAGEVIAWRGALTDAFGRPVGFAEIHLIGGNGELVARTAAAGSFVFSEVPSGTYEVAVVLDGREVAYRKALRLSATSAPSRVTLVSGGRLLLSGPGK